jgi:hypothetical protein
MGNDLKNERFVDGDESVYRIVDDLPERHGGDLLKNAGLPGKGMNHWMDSLTLFTTFRVIFHQKSRCYANSNVGG